MKDAESHQELLLRYLDGNLLPEEETQVADLLRCDPEARAFLREVAEQAVTVADVERVEQRRQRELEARQDWVGNRREALSRIRGPRTRFASWPWVVAAAIALTTSLYFLRPIAERPVAKVTGLNGSLQWTGNGGRVFHDLSVGAELPGGTVEGMTPGSWFELEFNDGSTITISGNSTLTFSDHGQKKLYLKEGSVSGNVKTQPAGKPMLIYTRSAMLEVLGTQFEVEVGLAATMLNVSEGKVRVKRLSDGNTVDVTAKHRVIAAADREMLPVPAPEAVSRWRSQLHLGPVGTHGKWLPGTDTKEARLGAIPYTIPQGITIYTAAFGVSRGDQPPVVLQPGCRFRVQGHIASTHEVYFGITVRYAGGGFAGRFQTIRPAVEFPSGEDFEVLLHLQDFRPDPLLVEIKDKLPSDPFHLVVESIWCHTLDQQSGLEITDVELLPPTISAHPAPQPEPPVMDIWAATSQGDLDTVKHHLSSGIDIDAPFIAPGIPASGATPLHIAVLSDQREIAQFLIEKSANINAQAKDEHGGTPLHWAAVLGRIEMARRLIDAGADINAKDKNEYTPLDWTSYERISEGKARLEIAELLQDKGAKKRDIQSDS
jgi:ferric-dicitrate binding protein FerR (iron transport regulator)